MQAIERIRTAMYHESDDLEFACNPAAMTEVLAHIDAIEAENERLRAESEERLQNCAALIAENEQLRKDAERYRWLRKTTNWVSSKGQRINVRDFPKSWDEHIDDAMKGTP